MAARDANDEYCVLANPEFLKEGAEVEGFMKPDSIIVDGEAGDALQTMRDLYASFSRSHDKTLVMDRRSAEPTKYAVNARASGK